MEIAYLLSIFWNTLRKLSYKCYIFPIKQTSFANVKITQNFHELHTILLKLNIFYIKSCILFFIPHTSECLLKARLAQSVEQLTLNQLVQGSSPWSGTMAGLAQWQSTRLVSGRSSVQL